MKYLFFVLTGSFSCSLFAQQNSVEPLSWTKDLIIYELATISFTSPHGPETGSFNSLKEKIPYLRDLGINAVWLSGHNWADHKHFYNIWTQYATIRPDSIDPVLGTPKDLKSMIDEFHRYDIKVFLDVITHGVMNYSLLIYEKLQWFKGGSWGMTDYDWYGGHKDLDDWWVDIHTKYVTEYGVDGFRLDVNMYRPDLWQKVKDNAHQAGHPIVVFAEHETFTDNVTDFNQTFTKIQTPNTEEFKQDTKYARDVASFIHEFIDYRSNNDIFRVVVTYMDGKEDFADIRRKDAKLSFQTKKSNQTSVKVTVKNIDTNKAIEKIEVYPIIYRIPFVIETSKSYSKFPLGITGLSEITMEFTPYSIDKAYLTNELSSHDRGWDGYPLGKNPYLAQGSRCNFGYSCLFTPTIPIFMSGEEFNADYVPFPSHSPYLFKKEKIGEGRRIGSG